MELTMDDVEKLIELLRKCITVESENVSFLLGGEYRYHIYHNVKKNCVGSACGEWLKMYGKWRRVYVGRCVEALYEYFNHMNKDTLLKHLSIIFTW